MVSPGVFEKAHDLRYVLYDRFLREECVPMDTWDWILSMPSRRRKALVRAWRQRQERGQPHPKYSFIKAFVKTENLPLFDQVHGIYGGMRQYIPRLIQAPHDETHLDAGRYLKPLTTHLKGAWSWKDWIFYASVSPEKLDGWLNRVRNAQSFFWADYSSFDATYSDEAWALLERLYSEVYPNAEPEFWQAINAWRRPVGSVRCRKDDAKIVYRAGVCNASGRDDTALANALFNGTALAMSIAAALCGVPLTSLQPHHLYSAALRTDIAVVGDDSLVACNFDVEALRPAIVSNLEAFGLVVKANSSTNIEDVTFLGQMPYPVGGTYYWGPTLGRRLYKAYWQCDPIGNLPAWTHGVAEQMRLLRHVPILYESASRICELLRGHKVTRQGVDPNRVWAARTAPTPPYDRSTIQFLSYRYGVSISAILADALTISQVNRLPALVRLHTLDAALALDDL